MIFTAPCLFDGMKQAQKYNSEPLHCPDRSTDGADIDMSVIVPVHNVEEYLPACIDSLRRQDGIHLEIILVNDGSTDRSGTVADRYGMLDSRIRIMIQSFGDFR